MGKIVPFNPPPGVFRNGTQYQVKGRWFDSNLVRWKDGRLKPIGGWSRAITTGLTGIGRAMFSWRDNSGDKWLAIGTSSNLYIFTSLSGSATSITPNNFTPGSDDAEAGTGFGAGVFNGSVITKTLTSDNISVSRSADTFTFTNSNTASQAGIDFTSFFAVGDEIQASGFSNSANNKLYSAGNSHRVTAVATTMDSSYPSNVATSVLTLGPENGSAAYGGSTLADESAGQTVTLSRSRRFGNENVETTSLVIEAASWVFDSFGQILIGMAPNDGRIYYWDPSTTNPTGVKAQQITNAPTGNRAVMVSKERHVFALGAGGDPRKVQFSDQEDKDTWTATATNQAGSFNLETQGQILAGKTVGSRILVWTTTDCHAIDHVGPPFVYGRQKIGDACGAISNRSMAVVGDVAYWMSQGGFFTYQGSVQSLSSTVSDYVFGDINPIQNSKIFAAVNAAFFEVTWWYASSGATEIDRYVTYNYQENWWSIGRLTRTAWEDAGVFDDPIAVADDNIIYAHEQSASTAARTTNTIATTDAELSDFDRNLVNGGSTSDVGLCFAETGGMEVGDGENLTNITQLITDQTSGDAGLRFKFKTRFNPNSTETESSALEVASDGYTDCRIQGRQFAYRVESGFDQSWEIGTIRADVSAGGRR
tara:strand:+ start:9497 stop:11443 length:1947 start_codon:yes stop_codon:yes gene_type:complete